MKLYADEGVDVPFVQELRLRGYTVTHALEAIRGARDEVVLQAANEEKAVLITKNKDFGEMIVLAGAESQGVVLIRIDNLGLPENIIYVAEVIEKYADELVNNFTVIQRDKVRIRKLHE